MDADGAVPAAENVAPTASFEWSATDLLCDFDASASNDPDGSITSYDWNFGDGTTGNGLAPDHTYAAAGDYTVTLTVTDDQGAIGTTSAIVSVSSDPPVNQSPVAAFTWSATNLDCSFDASGSDDPDEDPIVSYAWDFGDGTTGSGAITGHEYSAAGTYTVTLTVTDDRGATGTAEETITVTAGDVPGEQALYAEFLLPMTFEERLAGRNTFITASAEVLVTDDGGAPVAGAVVTAQWSGAAANIVSGTTDGDGRVMLRSDEAKVKNKVVVFTVTILDVEKSGAVYEDPDPPSLTDTY
ncbi:MAG: PKD domain-containing protein [Phycisphaerales bacterium]|nr:MAG: PKD domain-containing protein [Phycisphaerales bacterium]